MTIIDSHQHFWNYDPIRHDWIDDDMQVIRKDFLPAELEKVYEIHHVSGCVAVQADQTEAETKYLIEIANKFPFVLGVVGWVDLLSDQLQDRLEYFSQFPTLKGFRHILQGEHPDFMLQPSFLKGIDSLNRYGFTYDILVKPPHLKNTIVMVEKYPNQKFNLCHLAKPYIKTGEIALWEKGIRQLSKSENVYCKISGMITEADYHHWKYEQLVPYLDVIVEAFGIDRLMFGSDWPVCLVAGNYGDVLRIVNLYFSQFTAAEQAMFYGGNSIHFYRL